MPVINFGIFNKKAVLSQGEPRDAAVNFDAYLILQRRHTCAFPATAQLSCWDIVYVYIYTGSANRQVSMQYITAQQWNMIHETEKV